MEHIEAQPPRDPAYHKPDSQQKKIVSKSSFPPVSFSKLEADAGSRITRTMSETFSDSVTHEESAAVERVTAGVKKIDLSKVTVRPAVLYTQTAVDVDLISTPVIVPNSPGRMKEGIEESLTSPRDRMLARRRSTSLISVEPVATPANSPGSRRAAFGSKEQ